METGFENFSDEELVKAAAENPENYAILVNRYKDQLLNFVIRHFIRDRAQAEDIVQEAFIKAYVNSDKFDVTKKWKTWLYKIAINCAYSFLRKPRVENIDDFIDTLELDDSPEKFTETQLQKDKLETALENLEPHYRLILDLYYKKDLSYQEISNVLSLAMNTVKTRIHRAKQQLIINFENL